MAAVREALVDAVVAALPVAVVFFSGWAYLSSYLGEFGIDATQVSVPLTTVLVYAFIPLQSWWLLGYLAICLVFGQILAAYAGQSELAANLAISVALAALVLLLFIVKWVASIDAAQMANFVWEGEKSHTIATVSSPLQPSEVHTYYESCREERRLRQIIGFTDQMYLLCRDKDMPLWRGRMYLISSSGNIVYTASLSHKPPEASLRHKPPEEGINGK